MTGVSFVVPVHNGAPWLRQVVEAIWAQADGRPMELLVVDDASTDGSAVLADALSRRRPLRVLRGQGRGAAAAINLGIRAASFPIIAQVDQDVVIAPGWMQRLLCALDDPEVAAAQGQYTHAPNASVPARIMGLDLRQRYAAITGGATGPVGTDHVCTGNSVYRADALLSVGLFDEAFGYGYDNDMSYRLRRAGLQLRFCPDATSVHHWRPTWRGYWAQQYGVGYGRMQIVAAHPDRIGGDAVSRTTMMLHPLLMASALVAAATGAGAAVGGLQWSGAAVATGGSLVAALALERLVMGILAARRFRSTAPLLFPVAHLIRDVVWVAAMTMWLARAATGVRSRPGHSMRGRASVAPVTAVTAATPSATRTPRVLLLIPAHNEADALPDVIADVRTHCPDCDVLVVDDGSSDDTAMVADHLGINWLQLPERMGVGSAMRAGLRYAHRRRYDVVVRLDGDGQHRAGDVATLVAPILAGEADVVLGSRYVPSGEGRAGAVRVIQRLLGWCLSGLTGQHVTDPTSGFSALGRPAVRLLCDHHPTGYPEPELRLLLSRHRLRVIELPVRTRARLAGRTSLTPLRIAAAGARVLLAMLIVPLRQASEVSEHD